MQIQPTGTIIKANNYTIKELEAVETELKDVVRRFDKRADFITETTIEKSSIPGYDLYLHVEFMGSDGIIRSMGRYLTK